MIFYAYTQANGSDEHTCARDLLLSLLEKHLPQCSDTSDISEITLCHNTFGAPYLSLCGMRMEGVFVSLSHSHGMCAVALSSSPVGVDIELVKDMPYAQRIEARFLSELQMPEHTKCKEHAFFYKWTYAEACFKATNRENVPLPVHEHKTITAPDGKRYVLCVVGGLHSR